MLTIKKVMVTSVVVLSLTAVLTGCGTSASEYLFQAFEKAAAAETQVPSSFELLKELEEKDQQSYQNIVTKGERDSANVQALITNTSASLLERQTALDTVKQQLDDAKAELVMWVDQLDKLKDDQLKQKAEQAVTAYTKRYDAFQELYAHYSDWLQSEQSIYDTMKADDTDLKSIQAAVSERNQIFQQVEELKQQFNDYTLQFNNARKIFYQASGIQVDRVVSSDQKAKETS